MADIIDIGLVQQAEQDIRTCMVDFKGLVFPIRYDAGELKKPDVLLLFDELQASNQHNAEIREAIEKIETRAKAIAEKEGIGIDAAKSKAEKLMSNVHAVASETQRFDLSATSRALSKLVIWLGLAKDGVPLAPTYSFFLQRNFDFHNAVISDLMEDFNRPQNASTPELQDSESQTANSDSFPLNTEPSEPPSIPASISAN